MLPVYPVKVNRVELVPKQTVVVPKTVPPTEFGNTETFTGVLKILSQPFTV